MPRIGTRKLHHMIAPMLQAHGIKVGRDYLFDLLSGHKLLIRQRKRRVITTDSRHWMRKYANLVAALCPDRPEQLWVSDITYIRIANQWGYLSLITDAYSHRIMGYCLRMDLSTQGCLEALQMALANRAYPLQPLIHHSDRGSQYCSEPYVNLLKANDIAISMTQHGDPYENALAERVNGIIKTEFNLYASMTGFEQTCLRVQNSIRLYNELRPHDSCDRLTPVQAHQRQGTLKKRWKQYPRKHQNKTLYPQEESVRAATSKKEAGTAPYPEQGHASFLRINQSNTNFGTLPVK